MEFNFSLASLFTEDGDIKEKRLERFKNKNLPFYTFHAGQESKLGEFRDVYTSLVENDKATKKKIKMQIKAAAELQKAKEVGKNPIIVFHPGHIAQKADVPSTVLRNLEIAVKEAENKKVIIALENMYHSRNGYFIGSDYKDMKHILKEIKSPWLKVCFDWGHANAYAWEYAKKTKNPAQYMKDFSYHSEFIDALNKKICYAHMHYNRSHQKVLGPKDEHMSLLRIPQCSIKSFERTIKEMVKKTSLLEHDFIHLEILPFTFWPNGSTFKEQLRSIKMLKKMMDKNENLNAGQ